MGSMMKSRLHVVIFALAALTAGGAASPVSAAGAAADGACAGTTRICGLDGPEDLVPIRGGGEIIASRLGGEGLDVIDTKTHQVSAFDPVPLPEAPDPGYPCAALKASGPFISHGLSIKPGADGADRLYVVRHGGREAIEIFRFSRPGDYRSLVWLGCVGLPKHFAGNAVTARRDGSFYVSSMTDASDAPAASRLAKLYAGQPSGAVLAWVPGAGFHPLPMGAMSGPNGLELSPDERWLYVNGWASREIVRVDLEHPDAPAGRLQVAFMPDNLRWAPDGSLIAAGVRSTPEPTFKCAGTHADGTPCVTRWTVVSVDPATMKLKAEIQRDDLPGFGDVSVALPLDGSLWLGDFDGHELAIVADTLSGAIRH
jgi:SMP-30/Gluconolactonase/LRE-like region